MFVGSIVVLFTIKIFINDYSKNTYTAISESDVEIEPTLWEGIIYALVLIQVFIQSSLFILCMLADLNHAAVQSSLLVTWVSILKS
jgi:hypothetical protein